MKRIIFIIFLLIFFEKGYSQNTEIFKPLRYNEDNSFLKNDSLANWYHKMKYTALSKNSNSFLSIGGELRYQYLFYKNEDWGDAPVDKDGYILSRFLAHADFRISKYFRTFIQLQSSLANGRSTATNAVEENPLDLHQAFVDLNIFPAEGKQIIGRIGRQEMIYGSQRLIGVRDGPNNRQSFDAAKIIYRQNEIQADVWYSNYVTAKKGIFDDAFSDAVNFWGAYGVFNKIKWLGNADIYYLGLRKQNSTFDDGAGRELRHSWGTRIWDKKNNWNYDLEAVLQKGRLNEQIINAFTVSSDISYSFTQLKRPIVLGLKTEIISGDKRYDDEKLNTFNPLFPRGAYFGQAALIGPSNLLDIHPSVETDINKKLKWEADADFFWRHSKDDGIYGPNVKLIYSGRNTSKKYIGTQWSTALNYKPNSYVNLKMEFTLFDAKNYLKEVGSGKNIFFCATTAQIKF